MTCQIYLGEYQETITGTAAIAYVAIDEQGRLIQADARTVKSTEGISLQAVKMAARGLYYLRRFGLAAIYTDNPTALAALRQECPPKGSRRIITDIRHRLAAIPYPVTLELAIGSAHSAAASTLARCAATKKKYCSPTAQQYKMLVHTL